MLKLNRPRIGLLLSALVFISCGKAELTVDQNLPVSEKNAKEMNGESVT